MLARNNQRPRDSSFAPTCRYDIQTDGKTTWNPTGETIVRVRRRLQPLA
jgi:hypothetical protein